MQIDFGLTGIRRRSSVCDPVRPSEAATSSSTRVPAATGSTQRCTIAPASPLSSAESCALSQPTDPPRAARGCSVYSPLNLRLARLLPLVHLALKPVQLELLLLGKVHIGHLRLGRRRDPPQSAEHPGLHVVCSVRQHSCKRSNNASTDWTGWSSGGQTRTRTLGQGRILRRAG